MQNVEDAKEVKIGRFYMVNTITIRSSASSYSYSEWRGSPVPILGHAHEDALLIGISDQHYHIDWRFVSEAKWKSWARSDHYRRTRSAQGAVIWERDVVKVERRRFKCKREHDVFPKVNWTGLLEAEYRHVKSNCRTCPHRGISLVGAPVRDGALVCPGHGLSFDVETGALRPRVLKGKA